MRQLLGELFVTRLEVALEIALPYLIGAAIGSVVAYGFIYLGRRIERFEWRRELEKGNRMGAVVREKIGKRDRRIRQLTKQIARDEAALDIANTQMVEINSLLFQMLEVIRVKPQAKARRRRA